jgi:hypothetical protein
VIILVMQRLHVADLVGYILDKEPGRWTLLTLPAVAEADEAIPIGGGWVHHRACGEPLHAAREPLHVLEEMRTAMGTYAYAAQYQQTPGPRRTGCRLPPRPVVAAEYQFRAYWRYGPPTQGCAMPTEDFKHHSAFVRSYRFKTAYLRISSLDGVDGPHPTAS